MANETSLSCMFCQAILTASERARAQEPARLACCAACWVRYEVHKRESAARLQALWTRKD